MNDLRRIIDTGDVDVALHHTSLVPPPAADTLGNGAAARLRDAMARFSSGDAHVRARADVDAAVAAVDTRALRVRVVDLTGEHLAMREDCDILADIGFVVPTEALSMVLGVPSAELAEVRRDVRSIVMSIGRGRPATAVTDNAAQRLLDRFDGRAGGAIATVSMLYQNHDATAALLASRLVADARGDERMTALARTVRQATADAAIGEIVVAAGALVEIGLDHPSHEFGAGPHRCPGTEVAETIVDGMCEVLRALDWQIDLARASFAPDGRATSIPRRYERSDRRSV